MGCGTYIATRALAQGRPCKGFELCSKSEASKGGIKVGDIFPSKGPEVRDPYLGCFQMRVLMYPTYLHSHLFEASDSRPGFKVGASGFRAWNFGSRSGVCLRALCTYDSVPNYQPPWVYRMRK